MKKCWNILVVVLCCVLICGIFAGCAEDAVGTEPETKQTVYLPASYKFTCKEKVDGKPLSIERKFTYDEAGRCIRCESVEEWREGYPSTRTFTFNYDDKGNLIEEIWHTVGTNKDGQVTEGTPLRYTYDYIYDDKGRVERSVTTEEYNGEISILCAFAFTYDAQCNVVTVEELVNGTARYYYHYDQQGRMVSDTRCTTLPEDYQPATENNYLYYQRVLIWGENGKIASLYEQRAYSVEEVGPSGLDQLEFKQTTSEFPFYYDDRGNYTGWNEEDQYKYDENGHLILEDRYEQYRYRGEWRERLVAKYTRDAYGNITGFENEKYSEEATYVVLELTASEAKAAKQCFKGGCRLSGACDIGDNLLQPVWPQRSYAYELLRLIPNWPW